MIAILEKTKHDIDFHEIVDVLEASHLRIETTNQETKILVTVDGKPRTISESSLRRHLKLSDQDGISSLPDTELFENLLLMGFNILPNQRFTFQKGQFSHQWKGDNGDKGGSLRKKSTELGSNDTEEMVNVLSLIEVANILTSGVAAASVSPVAGVSAAGVPTNIEQAEADLTVGEKIELINKLVKYQDHHVKILKYQAQQSKPLSKKEQKEFYMSVLRSHAGWKSRHFKGMALEEIKEKFIPIWKQLEDFVPMSSKEEGERVKRQGLKIEQGSSKRMKTSEDVSKEDVKGMMQLVPLEEVYVKALHVKHPIID
nr:hypothetical protein [Tanacetum cinerariifolium]